MEQINNNGTKRNSLLIPIIIVGAIALILAIVLIVKMPQMIEIQKGLQSEKEALEVELTELSESYNNLKTENDTLNEQMLRYWKICVSSVTTPMQRLTATKKRLVH